MTSNGPGQATRHDPPGPFLDRQGSASARRRQRRSCSLRCACSTLTPSTHRQDSPGSRNRPSLSPARPRHQKFRPPNPKATGPRRPGGGRARSDLRHHYEQQRDSHPEAHARSSRPAEALLPNSPSCGNQPANISLTAPSRYRHARHLVNLIRSQKRRPRSHPGRRFALPS